MQHLSKRFLSIVLSFAFFAASLIVYSVFIKPIYATIKQDQGTLDELRSRNDKFGDLYKKLKDALGTIQSNAALRDRISMAFPLEPNVPDVVNQLTATALANGLSVQSVEVTAAPLAPSTDKNKAETIVKPVGILRTTVRMSGTYEQLKAFLGGIETNVRITSIRSVKASKSANPTATNQLDIAFEAEMFYQAS